jgi:hypothetical protein
MSQIPHRTLLALCLAFALALGAMGCGGSSAAGTTAEASTKAAFIKAGDEICEKADQRQKAALQAQAPENPDKAEQERLVRAYGLPAIQSEAEQLDGLAVPDQYQAEVHALVLAIEEAVRKAEENPGSVLSGSGPFVGAEKLASDFGFDACSKPS